MVKPVAFISHRHNDKPIADALKKHLLEWGVAEGDISQSSDPTRTTTAQHLARQLRLKLESTNLLLIIYTYSEEDWSWPMLEYGVAQGKSTVDTTVVVLQCTADEPTLFKGHKLVNLQLGPDEVRGFVEDFHKREGFIPNEPEDAFSPNMPDQVISERARRLYDDLRAVLPGAREDKHLWDFIRLRIEPSFVGEIRNLQDNPAKAIAALKENLELRKPKYVGLGYNINTAVRQFGFATYEEGMRLADLIEKWLSLDKTGQTGWIDDLYEAIYKAVTNNQPPAVAHPFKSVREGADWWFFAPVTRIRVNRDNSREFDVYLVRCPTNMKVAG
jgi:hypothetical protein